MLVDEYPLLPAPPIPLALRMALRTYAAHSVNGEEGRCLAPAYAPPPLHRPNLLLSMKKAGMEKGRNDVWDGGIFDHYVLCS